MYTLIAMGDVRLDRRNDPGRHHARAPSGRGGVDTTRWLPLGVNWTCRTRTASRAIWNTRWSRFGCGHRTVGRDQRRGCGPTRATSAASVRRHETRPPITACRGPGGRFTAGRRAAQSTRIVRIAPCALAADLGLVCACRGQDEQGAAVVAAERAREGRHRRRHAMRDLAAFDHPDDLRTGGVGEPDPAVGVERAAIGRRAVDVGPLPGRPEGRIGVGCRTPGTCRRRSRRRSASCRRG